MQRREEGGVVLSCDFCGTDWDEIKPMIEGHKGSILCLSCLKRALQEAHSGEGEYRCTLCLRESLPADLPRWRHPEAPEGPGVNREATVCQECLEQAAKAFSRDPDVDWVWEKARGRGKRPNQGEAE